MPRTDKLRTNVLGLDLFRGIDVDAEGVAKKREGLAEVFDGNADVIENGLHPPPPARSMSASAAV
jgi:hypothetical protein